MNKRKVVVRGFQRKQGQVCASILQENGEDVIKSAATAIKCGADLLEIRLDALTHLDPELVRNILKQIPHPLIATNRMKEEGGFFQGSETERIDALLAATEWADYVDVELQTRDKYKSEIRETARSTIISYHNFQETPPQDELIRIARKATAEGDLAKLAVMPRNMQDTLLVLELISRCRNTIAISMGKLGSYTRIAAPLFGSPITYASLDGEVAPGQLDIKTTRDILDVFIN
ncbi:MAG TPA: type I 3-dehydroquinate dehydratase [Methanobacteriaceae archaeon]|nr:type I 3-dehydroquinate dehydratase [Methanobacteriaceae archaeon]HNS25929.1 type I 3-dehydroquinate dehydratase [Methanobacteriaceae archaeon]